MSGLNLIQSYLSESEESAEDQPETKDISISKSEIKPLGIRLPVPESILAWGGVKHHETVIDDPSLHDGRIRSFKHERGNWTTLVYIDYPANCAIHSWLRKVVEEFRVEGIKSFSEFHLSLTRSLVLKFHWIDSFVDGVRILCQRTDKMVLELKDLKVYCNEERTRTFLAIQCEDRNRNLQSLVTGLDKLLTEYQLPSFYEEASFHVSVMWCLGDAEKTLTAKLSALNESLSRVFTEDLTHNDLEVSNIHCKIGNKLYIFALQ